MKRLILFLISATILLIFNISGVSACSYGEIPPPTVDSMLEGAVLVRGVVIENSAGNSIIEVERYLQGSGSRYLLLYRQSPENYIVKRLRGYDFGCGYAASAVADVGTRAYFSLGYSAEGIYRISYFEEESMFFIEETDDGQRVNYWENEEAAIIAYSASLDDFEAMIAQRTGHPSVDPVERSQLPRFRTLMIQTESGQTYQLPIDSNEISPVESPSACVENCEIVSPDGSHHLSPIPNEANAYWFWYYPNHDGSDWSQGIGEGEGMKYPSTIQAETILFSPNSNHLLAWYEGTISLYRVSAWSGMYGYYPSLERVWSAQLAVTETMTADNFAGFAAWSGNSHVFAYWDADGLKWLDLTMMLVPRLILQHESANIQSLAQTSADIAIPPVLELSNTGRYIRYGDTEEWTLLDVLTDTKYDDMLVSPDETSFRAIEPEIYPHQLRNQVEEGECIMFDLEGNCLMLTPQRTDACVLPLVSCSGYVSLHDFQLRELYWQERNMVYMICENSESNLCYARSLDFKNPNAYSSFPADRFVTNAFAYDEIYGYIAWATDDYQLRLGVSIYDEPLDFSDVLDSPIASLEWGEPLWYQEGR